MYLKITPYRKGKYISAVTKVFVIIIFSIVVISGILHWQAIQPIMYLFR